jgi:S-formylglutathione hydrolase FrmB
MPTKVSYPVQDLPNRLRAALDPQHPPAYTQANRRPRRSAPQRRRRGFVPMAPQRILLAFILVATSLAACARVQPAQTATAQSSPTATVTPLPSATITPTGTATLPAGCAELTGTLRQADLEIRGDDRPLDYWVYLPPCVEPDRDAPYPTLYLLHGLAQSESEWVNLGVAKTADALITQGSAPAFIIVMPGERTGYDMLEALVDVLLPYMERTFPTGGQRGLRAIGGISRGAGWALRIGMQRPDLFGAIGLHSPAVISPDLYSLPTWARETPPNSIPRLWVDIGIDDTLLPDALKLREQLDKLHWPYTWSVDSGEHTSTYWSGHLEQYLRWYAAGWPTQVPPGESGQS